MRLAARSRTAPSAIYLPSPSEKSIHLLLTWTPRDFYNLLYFFREAMRKNDFSLVTITATRGLQYNVKINAHRSHASIVPALCLATSERPKGFRRYEEDFRKSGAEWDTSKN